MSVLRALFFAGLQLLGIMLVIALWTGLAFGVAVAAACALGLAVVATLVELVVPGAW